MAWFPQRWRPQYPNRIQLYSLATPNGQKIGIALEEMELEYEAHKINILEGDQFDEDFVKISPNSKIPALIDPHGPDGAPLTLMESGAILLYLAEKSGKLLPQQKALQWETVQWLFFQVGHIGPMFGQFGHFYKYAKGKTSDTYAVDRYSKEAKRLLGVLEARLKDHEYLAADQYTVADIATVPWVLGLDFYKGKEHLDYASFPHVEGWVQRCRARPAFQRGQQVCALD